MVRAQQKRGFIPEPSLLHGALQGTEYAQKLSAAGFVDVSVEPWRIYQPSDARDFLTNAGIDIDAAIADAEGKFASAFIRARKPI